MNELPRRDSPLRVQPGRRLVPVLAAMAGAALLAEPLTGRLLIAGPLVLGGVGLALLARR